MKSRYNKNVLSMVSQIDNLLINLDDLHLLYFYKKSKLNISDGNQIISWSSHEPGRENSGKSFTTLAQYQHIIETSAFHCILYDGSILRTSLVYDGPNLVKHSHLWWPAPYSDYNILDSEFTPELKFEEFITDPSWINQLRMRSPIRIDFDSKIESFEHPLVHMHTQHHDTRINLEKPICFARFVDFIFNNYYPNIILNLDDVSFQSFKYAKPQYKNYKFSSLVL